MVLREEIVLGRGRGQGEGLGLGPGWGGGGGSSQLLTNPFFTQLHQQERTYCLRVCNLLGASQVVRW